LKPTATQLWEVLSKLGVAQIEFSGICCKFLQEHSVTVVQTTAVRIDHEAKDRRKEKLNSAGWIPTFRMRAHHAHAKPLIDGQSAVWREHHHVRWGKGVPLTEKLSMVHAS
jgi:hypothetical protein